MMGLSVLKMHLHDMKRKTTTCVSHHLHSVAEKKKLGVIFQLL